MSINPLTLPTEPFNVSTLQGLMRNGMLRDHLDAINYIAQFYFENESGGTYYKYNPETLEFDFKEKKDFTNEVLNKVDNDKDVVKYFKTNSKIYNIVSEVLMPRHYNIGNRYYINLCQGLLHKEVKPYAEYSNEIKAKVQIALDMIKEITCSNDEALFNAYIKWYGKVVRGEQTQVIIYKKSPEGTGKSTETDFIMKYVIGEKVSVLPNTECLTTNFNKCLMGKILVIFEELPTFSANEWAGVSTKLKGYATNPTLQFRDLYEKAMVAKNVFNAIINTNLEAIKNSEQRRIVIMPINTIRMKDHDYFGYIRKNIYNMGVGEAFYAYLLSIDVSNYNAQRDFPITDEKKNVISQLLPSPYKFLKSFIISKTEIGTVKPKELYRDYLAFCENEKLKPLIFSHYIEKLKDIQIVSVKKSGEITVTITLNHLQAIATKFNWLNDYDEDEISEEDVKIKISKTEYEEFSKWKEQKFQSQLEIRIEELDKSLNDTIKVKKILKKKPVVVEPVIEQPVVEQPLQKVIKKIIKKKGVEVKEANPELEEEGGDMIMDLLM